MPECGCHSHGGFLTAKGYQLVAAQRERQLDAFLEVGLTRDACCSRLDKSGSVSGSGPVELHWNDAVIEDQHRRFIHHGS